MPRIRAPHPTELERLREIDRETGPAFAAIGMREVADHDPPPVAELEGYRAAGRALVAVDERDEPVAYLIWSTVGGDAFVEQVSVAPSHARRGIGAALIDHLGHLTGLPVALTTFRDVPWNAPYYSRLGFGVIEPGDQGPDLAALIAREAVRIPGDAPRVAMRRA
jgi:GNAT superfamily N-acetyltransferase